MLFTPEELKNLVTLCEVGAKALSSDKPLHESANIQATALDLIRKLAKAHEKPPEEPKA
jgi:hypothetical protein